MLSEILGSAERGFFHFFSRPADAAARFPGNGPTGGIRRVDNLPPRPPGERTCDLGHSYTAIVKRRLFVLIVLSALLATAAILWGLSRLTPSWWSPPTANDAQAALLADRVEYGVIELAHKIRDDDQPWSIRLTQTQVNAWLALRLRPWIEREFDGGWPERVALLQACLRQEGLTMTAELIEDGGRQFVSVDLHPRVAQGQLYLELGGAALGRLPIPSWYREGTMRQAVNSGHHAPSPATNRELPDLITGSAGIHPILPLADDRRVELLQLTFGPGELIATFRTLPTSGNSEAEADAPADPQSRK
jgi:hypothetical protein